MSVEDREDLSISKRNFNLQNCALEIEVAFDRVSGRARELIASRLPEAISREEDELSAGCSHDFRVRHELRFPVKRRNVISEVCRQSIMDQRDLVEESGSAGAAVNLLKQDEIWIRVRDECSDSRNRRFDVVPSDEGISTTVVKEMVASSRQKLDVEGNDFNRLIGRKNGRSLGVAGLLLLKEARMIIEVPRSQKSARYGSSNSGRDPERAFSRSVLSPK